MIRDFDSLCGSSYDIIVVGGGVHGICAARDAALRGYKVALLERGDFGGETSHNSLKLVHGGMRYIQHLDFRRMRQSIRERRAWLRIAPNLVRPLRFAIHTYGWMMRGPVALAGACALYNLMSLDANRGVPAGQRVSMARVSGPGTIERLIPGVADARHNGVACWFDGQMQNADRLMWACLRSAVAAGASVANYAEVTELRIEQDRVVGVVVKDVLGGESRELAAPVVINASGPWVDSVLAAGRGSAKRSTPKLHPHNLNMNIVTRSIGPEHAIGVQSRERSDSLVDSGGRLLFITPWRGVSVIGTTHVPYAGDPDSASIGEQEISAFLAEVNDAYPVANLTMDDVYYCYWGLTPGTADTRRERAVRSRHGSVICHHRLEGVAGLVSIVGVKWTTARLLAEQAVDMASRKLPGGRRACVTDNVPLPGAISMDEVDALCSTLESAAENSPGAQDLRHAVEDFGTSVHEVLACRADGDGSLFEARVRHALRHELAQRVEDVLLRRVDHVQRGLLSEAQLEWCADEMARHHGWSANRRQEELLQFERKRTKMHARISGSPVSNGPAAQVSA